MIMLLISLTMWLINLTVVMDHMMTIDHYFNQIWLTIGIIVHMIDQFFHAPIFNHY